MESYCSDPNLSRIPHKKKVLQETRNGNPESLLLKFLEETNFLEPSPNSKRFMIVKESNFSANLMVESFVNK